MIIKSEWKIDWIHLIDYMPAIMLGAIYTIQKYSPFRFQWSSIAISNNGNSLTNYSKVLLAHWTQLPL